MENRVKLTSEELLSSGVNACKSYSDYNDNIVNLSDEEISLFNETVELVRKATGYTGSIELAEIDEEKGKAVRGCYFPCSGEIFIDTFELHWWHMIHDKNGLIETICHEIAHNKYLYHCKGHRELTEKLVNIIKEFQRKTNTEETVNAKTKVKAVRKKEKKGGEKVKNIMNMTDFSLHCILAVCQMRYNDKKLRELEEWCKFGLVENFPPETMKYIHNYIETELSDLSYDEFR